MREMRLKKHFKLLIIILNFLEQSCYTKPLITHAKIFMKKGVFISVKLF